MVLATTNCLNKTAKPIYPAKTASGQSLPTMSDLFSQCCASGQVTLRDRYALQAILLNPSPTEEDLAAIDRILHGIRRGWLTVEQSSSH